MLRGILTNQTLEGGRKVSATVAESQKLFVIIAELQQTLDAFNRIERATKRGDELAPARRDVH